MKKANELEIDGIGKVYVYSIKVDKPEFKQVTPDMKEVKGKRVGETSKTVYMDSEGKEHTKDEIGYSINGRFIQKVERSEKVKTYKIVDKTEYTGNFLSDSFYVVVPVDTSTDKVMREKGLYDDKGMEFTYKKSSTGMSFHRAVITSFQGVLFMDTAEKPAFKSMIAEQVKAELYEKNALMAALAENKSEVCVKAEEIEVIV
jgi:hypothetical protein